MPSTFSSHLLQWYKTHGRALPWRETKDPYAIWVSEIMLQQTQVETVKNYYTRFLNAFPTVESLANANEDHYLKLWEGLGYYRRVKNLHKGATQVQNDHHGIMPTTYHELLKIHGIGSYTAAAIASIAFEEKVPAVDGNLLRIFARLSTYSQSVKTEKAKKDAFAFFHARMGEKDFGNVNQALMDIGATICTPKGEPKCTLCPIRTFCKAYAQNETKIYPIATPKKEKAIEKLTVFVLHDSQNIAINKRPPTGLLASLYEFPNMQGHLSLDEVRKHFKHLPLLRIKPIGLAKHIFTHKVWLMQGYDILLSSLDSLLNLNLVPLAEVQQHLALPTAFSAYKAYFVATYGEQHNNTH